MKKKFDDYTKWKWHELIFIWILFLGLGIIAAIIIITLMLGVSYIQI